MRLATKPTDVKAAHPTSAPMRADRSAGMPVAAANTSPTATPRRVTLDGSTQTSKSITDSAMRIEERTKVDNARMPRPKWATHHTATNAVMTSTAAYRGEMRERQFRHRRPRAR